MVDLAVEILTPTKPLFEGEASGVTVPGVLGYMTILPGHTPFISEIGVGELIVTKKSGPTQYFVSGGYVEVQGNKLKVLADIVDLPENIDSGRAKEAMGRAQKRLDEKDANLDLVRAQAALKRAEYRLQIAKTIGGVAHNH